MTTSKTLQMQLRLNNGTLILALVVDKYPIQIGFHYTGKDPQKTYYTPINPERMFLENQLLAALADPQVNETGKRIAPLVLEAAQQLLEATHTITAEDTLIHTPEMTDEYGAWQSVVEEFRLLGQDINDSKFNRQVQAILLWAEHLVSLRQKQAYPDRVRAMKCAKASYLHLKSLDLGTVIKWL